MGERQVPKITTEKKIDRLVQKYLDENGLPDTIANLVGICCGLALATGYSPLEVAKMATETANELIEDAGKDGKYGLWDGASSFN